MVQIDQLYIVAGATRPGTYNEEEELAREQTLKQALLVQLEEEWRQAEQQQSSQGWWSWSPLSMPANVIANLQVTGEGLRITHTHSLRQ